MIALLDGVPEAYATGRLLAAGGNEIGSGKFESASSSAALAVNTFAWFHDEPAVLPSLWPDSGQPVAVEVEYCARFPWRGGKHPWLDAAVLTRCELIGVESKRFEPYRDAKKVSLSSAYDRPVWGDGMSAYESLRDRLRARDISFVHLDAAQLLKHAFGLVTEGRRLGLAPKLVYLFSEPASVAHRALAKHREEIDRFDGLVRGADVKFRAISYREWLDQWNGSDPRLDAHRQAILRTFAP
jgi:hypothetical protein